MDPSQILLDVVVAIVLGGGAYALAKKKAHTHTLTILVCGGTGVGKSTLVNVLGGRQVAAVGTGSPLTRNTERFTFSDAGLVIYDSKGLEVQEASQIYLLLLSDILRLRYGPHPAEHVDFILMCIQEPQGRIDDAHREIAGLCEDLRIPFGIAITKTLGGSIFEGEVKTAFPSASFVQRVRALEFHLRGGQIAPAEGVDKLLGSMQIYGQWNELEARRRAQSAAITSQLSMLARRLSNAKELVDGAPVRVTSESSDKAWIEFATMASTLLHIRPSAWKEYMIAMREGLKKQLVPGFIDRYILKKFDSVRIDGANARRIVPIILRRFAVGSVGLRPEDLGEAIREAIASFENNRPYRSRFR